MAIFFLLSSYIVGHLLSIVSHFLTRFVYGSFSNCIIKRKIYDERAIHDFKKSFCENYIRSDNVQLLQEGVNSLLIDKGRKKSINSLAEQIALSTSDDYTSRMIYNSLVISGMFRALTIIFFFYVMLLGFELLDFTKPIFDLHKEVCDRVSFLLFLFSSFSILSFTIYVKYHRRYIELCESVLVLHESGFIEKSKDRD